MNHLISRPARVLQSFSDIKSTVSLLEILNCQLKVTQALCRKSTDPQVLFRTVDGKVEHPNICNDIAHKQQISCFARNTGIQRRQIHTHCARRRSWTDRVSKSNETPLTGDEDKYRGLWVCLSQQRNIDMDSLTEQQFDDILKASLKTWKDEGLSSVWLQVPVSYGKFAGVASQHGFVYHHAEGHQATLCLWIDAGVENKIPRFATHQIGVSGIVINDETEEVLVVQDKNRARKLWKFPGGLSDLSEDIAFTAQREVFEETGLRTGKLDKEDQTMTAQAQFITTRQRRN